MEIFSSAKVVVSRQVQQTLQSKWPGIMEEADEELNLKVAFGKKTYSFEGSWHRLVQLHELITEQLNMMSEEDDFSTTDVLRSTFIGHSPSVSELGVTEVKPAVRSTGGSLRQSLSSLNHEDNFRSSKIEDDMIGKKASEVNSSFSQSNSLRYDSGKGNNEIKPIIAGKRSEHISENALPIHRIDQLAKENDQLAKEKPVSISKHDTTGNGIERSSLREKGIERQVSNSSMPSLEACTIVTSNDDEELKLELTLNEGNDVHSNDYQPSQRRQAEQTEMQGHDDNDFSSNFEISNAKKSDELSNDLQLSIAHLEEEYTVAKSKSDKPEKAGESDNRNTILNSAKYGTNGSDNHQNMRNGRVLNSYDDDGSFDMFAAASHGLKSEKDRSNQPHREVLPDCDDSYINYIDSATWAFVRRVYNDELQRCERRYKVSIQCDNEENSNEFQIVSIKAIAADVEKEQAIKSFEQLIERTQQECSVEVVKTARKIPYEACIKSMTELNKSNRSVVIKDLFQSERKFLFIGRHEEAVAVSRSFKHAIGMLPPVSRAEDHGQPAHYNPQEIRYEAEFPKREIDKCHEIRQNKEHLDEVQNVEEKKTSIREAKGSKTSHESETRGYENGVKLTGQKQERNDRFGSDRFWQNDSHKDKSTEKSDSRKHMGKHHLLFDEDDNIPGGNGMIKSVEMRDGVQVTKYKEHPVVVQRRSQKEEIEQDGDSDDDLYGNLNKKHELGRKPTDISDSRTSNHVSSSSKSAKATVSYNIDSEIQSVKLAKQQSQTIQLLYELLDNQDPDATIYNLIDEILIGKEGDTTMSSYFQESLLPSDDEVKAASFSALSTGDTKHVVNNLAAGHEKVKPETDINKTTTYRTTHEPIVHGKRIMNEESNKMDAVHYNKDVRKLNNTKPDNNADEWLMSRLKKDVSSSTDVKDKREVYTEVPPNKKIAHGTIMAESFYGEEPLGPASIHSNDSLNESEDEVHEPLEILKRVYQPPDGIMHRLIDKKYNLPGHPNEGSQLVTFTFKEGRQQSDGPKPRETYNGAHITSIIPNGPIGKGVYKLMKEAFDQRKLFTIQQISGDNCISSRVPFKSDKKEYPDEDYLPRLKASLEIILEKK